MEERCPVIVVLASAGRPALLEAVALNALAQTHEPDEVIVCVPDAQSVSAQLLEHSKVVIVYSEKGLTRQRNAALRNVVSANGLVFFLDDDAWLRNDYIEKLAGHFKLNSDVGGATGLVIYDGAVGESPLSLEAARAKIAGFEDVDADHEGVEDVFSLYGCNMVIRQQALADCEFDERLPLYGWLEDLDMSRQLSQGGWRLVRLNSAKCVHLGSASGGRLQHRRFGYSQIATPLFLWRKGSISLVVCARLALRPFLANCVYALHPQHKRWRMTRLVGNCVAFWDAVLGRVNPLRIESM